MYYIAQIVAASVARTYLSQTGFMVVGENPEKNPEMKLAVIDLNRRWKTAKDAKPHLDRCNAVTPNFTIFKL